ncbi:MULTISPECIES: extracellular solute-binding protein [Actinomadura]|uniref:Extracellular solute-binding protein n=1 Tax=Actinomadura litoris TaxID=2678616 RepID=A0A7K1KX05_9ACTN|nr:MULTISPECIES: extracellular solute-binding protein [Actinomadura]MBT2210844.1 extracellular solute-binding protein [Actinomadura sp. NEAU-AAG7]MUN36738.1 extracellular solute-binding protein [Actinomadura litoris]
MKRHLTVAIATGLTVALGVSGCGKGSSSDDGGSDGKSIKFVAAIYDSNAEPYWKALIKDFEAKNSGYKVQLEMVDWTQMDAKVKTYIQTKQAPDLLNYNSFSDFARDGLIYKASEVVSPTTLSDFTPTFVEQSKYNGDQYALPFISSARLLFYNKDLFAKAKIANPPKTWDEVKTDAEKIQKEGGATGYGLPLGPEESQAEFYSWAMNNGGGWVDASGKWAINQPANVETLNFLKGLKDAKLTQPNPETTDRKTVFNQFAQGKIGMAIGGPFTKAGFIDPVNKNLNFGVTSLPSKSGTEHNTLGVMDLLAAFKKNDGKNKEALKKFLDFLYQKENTSTFLKKEGFLPVTKSAGDALSSDPYMKQFVDALPSSKFAPTSNPAWSAVAGAVKQSLGSSVANKDPKKVLDDIQKTAEKSG